MKVVLPASQPSPRMIQGQGPGTYAAGVARRGGSPRQRRDDLGWLQRILLALIVLDIPFAVDIHYRYDEYLASLNALGGLQLSLTTFCTFGIYALWFFEAALNRFVVDRSRPRADRFLVLYLIAVVFSGLYASRRDLAVNELIILSQTFLIYFFIIRRVRSRNDVIFLATALILTLFLHAAVLIGSFGLGRSIRLGPWNVVFEESRAGGTMGSPNSAGSFLELLLAPCLAMLLMPLQRWRTVLAQAAFCAGVAGLILTFSRGSWLASVVSVFLFCAIAWYRGWLPRKIAISFGVSIAIAGVVFSGAILERLFAPQAATTEGRFALMRLAQRIISDSPILGVGANNYAAVMDDYISHPEFTGAWLHTVHNKFLLVWAENGIVGLIGFVGFLIATAISGWRVWRVQDALLSPLGLAISAAILGQMLHMNLDLFHTRPEVQLLWVVCALVASIKAIAVQPSRVGVTIPAGALRRRGLVSPSGGYA